MVTSRVGIASQFLQNAYVNGEQAARSLDELARNALFSGYFGGNTRVRTTLGAPGTAWRSMTFAASRTPSSMACSSRSAHPIRSTVTVGTNAYTLVGVAADVTNVSTDAERRVRRADVLGNVIGLGRHGGQCGDRGQRLGHRPAVAARHHRRH